MNLEKLQEDFEIYGLQATDTDCLSRCVKLCDEYNLSAEQLAIYWLEYATLYDYNEITINTLATFEKVELVRRKNKTESKDSPIPIYIPTSGQDEELLAAYGASPAHRSQKVTSSGKLNYQQKKKSSKCLYTSKDLLSNSPLANKPSQKYSARNNAGIVVCSVGDKDTSHPNDNISFIPEVTISGFSGTPISSNYEFMFEKLRINALTFEDSIGDIADMMKESLNIEDWSPLNITSNEPLWFIGRVCCDSCGRLNAASVLLEGNREVSSGAVVKLDLSKLSSYSIFPGQVVAVKGVNTTGNCVIAREILPGIALPPYTSSVTVKRNFNVRIASGPFTTSDNLLFEPLSDFLKQVAANPPHILILIGPLVEPDHQLLIDDDLNETFDSIASHCMTMIAQELQHIEIKTFVISSCRDIDCLPIYPTPPRDNEMINYKNITSLPDPSLLVIEGVSIGITAADVLMDLSREEISFPPQSFDRLARLSQHLIQQQTFYPLYPPPEEFSLCLAQWENHAKFSFTPNILIVPSKMRYFVKDLENCFLVNPERLSKGQAGGCYANLTISSRTSERPVINAEIIKI